MQKLFFAGTSRLTEFLPVFGARFLDHSVRPIAGSRALSAMYAWRNAGVVERLGGFRRFLVVSDIHIGDAVLSQSALTAIRDYFPESEIDYVVNRTAATVIDGNPEATRVIPLFANSQFPSADELAQLATMIRVGGYDLCILLSPFIAAADVAPASQPVVSILSHAPTIVRNDGDPDQVNHFSFQQYHFLRDLLGAVAHPVRSLPFRGVRTTHAEVAIDAAHAFAAAVGIEAGSKVVMINPDAASIYNMLPFERQSALLHRVAADTDAGTTILLGAGHTAAGIGMRLRNALPPELRARVTIIPPAMRLDAYAALIDRADIFITGDTGPLHLAAARRYPRSGGHQFRNATAVLSIFGATMPRMSGYDSVKPGYISTNQDAPSWCYQAGSRCRNITCLNKMLKTCRTVRCFEEVDVDGLADLVGSYLARTARIDSRAELATAAMVDTPALCAHR